MLEEYGARKGETNIFLVKTNESVARTYTAYEVKLAPRRMTLSTSVNVRSSCEIPEMKLNELSVLRP